MKHHEEDCLLRSGCDCPTVTELIAEYEDCLVKYRAAAAGGDMSVLPVWLTPKKAIADAEAMLRKLRALVAAN